MDKSLIDALSLIKSSKYRINIVQVISSNVLTPSEISFKTGIRLNHVSMHLSLMKEKDVVKCLNESDKKGRLYQLTDTGQQVLGILKTR